MKISEGVNINSKIAVERLIALWALNESGIGGIFHAFKLPFSGIVVGGFSLIIISMIARLAQDKKQILKALILVLVIKAAVSPHSPIGAYIAVSFQGMAAFIFFKFVKNFSMASFLTAILAMLQSAFQKIIILALLFGNPLAMAIDNFGGSVFKQFVFMGIEDVSLTKTLIFIYVGVYLLGGIAIGFIMTKISTWISEFENKNIELIDIPATVVEKPRSFWPKILRLVIFSLFLVLLFFYSENIMKPALVFLPMLRVLLILVLWYFIVSPILIYFIKKMLKKKETKYSEELHQAFTQIGFLRQLAAACWHVSGSQKGLTRIKYFLSLFLFQVIVR